MWEELKPCPFCGSSAELFGDLGSYYVRCQNKDCETINSLYKTRAEAIYHWNSRAENCINEVVYKTYEGMKNLVCLLGEAINISEAD